MNSKIRHFFIFLCVTILGSSHGIHGYSIKSYSYDAYGNVERITDPEETIVLSASVKKVKSSLKGKFFFICKIFQYIIDFLFQSGETNAPFPHYV